VQLDSLLNGGVRGGAHRQANQQAKTARIVTSRVRRALALSTGEGGVERGNKAPFWLVCFHVQRQKSGYPGNEKTGYPGRKTGTRETH